MGVRIRAAVGFLAALAAAGCERPQSVEQRIDFALSQSGKSRAEVYPLAGRVLIDGRPAQFEARNERLIVMLNDPADANLSLNARPHVECDSRGKFAFTTRGAGDGLPPGRFVVTIAALRQSKRGFHGPDGLKNLYNDPDRNARDREFQIDHQAPGKSDFVFDLKVKGRPAVKKPGPRPLTGLSE